jgi:fructan beta-fructosidase
MRPLHILFVCLLMVACKTSDKPAAAVAPDSVAHFTMEKHRPQIHFSPKEKWMNDPNGMVYHNGEYHLFYQYYPDGTKWGPMHWGHAVSTDLVHWQHLPVALYPDSLGYIFSGSAVLDKNNTSGLGTKDNPPLIAIYTYHDAEKEKAGRDDFQYQGIAYSLDNGRTWTKYQKNPVLPNQGIRDFRDPKVFWHNETSRWVMTLAVKDHIEFWGSPDLKAWTKLSEFGKDVGAHGGVWECPDLFEARVEGEDTTRWLLFVSINPGGPNGGSATQYFTGVFDGTRFTPDDARTTQWLDYGPDNYAGVTWSGAPDNRKIFLGWMSNWAYAEVVPTEKWRSAMTLPRDISLKRSGKNLYARSTLSPEVLTIATEKIRLQDVIVRDSVLLTGDNIPDASQLLLQGVASADSFSIVLYNDIGQELVIGFDGDRKEFYVDRGRSGRNDFSEKFTSKAVAPRIAAGDKIPFKVVTDVSSVEVFFDDGLSVMTSIHFPDQRFSKLKFRGNDVRLESLEVRKLSSIWERN